MTPPLRSVTATGSLLAAVTLTSTPTFSPFMSTLTPRGVLPLARMPEMAPDPAMPEMPSTSVVATETIVAMTSLAYVI